MMRMLLPSIMAISFACGPVGRAQAPFSCDQAFGSRLQGEALAPELRAWIVFTARRFVRDSARSLREKHLASDDFCIFDLSCVSDEEIVAFVRRRCAWSPAETLENAIQHGRIDALFARARIHPKAN
jgi:hypothetical protein